MLVCSFLTASEDLEQVIWMTFVMFYELDSLSPHSLSLYRRVQREHFSKHLLLCSTEESLVLNVNDDRIFLI